MPGYKEGQAYQFSSQKDYSFGKTKVVTEKEGKFSLSVLVDFMKSEIAERDRGITYEPLFTQLIKLRDQGHF